MKPVSPAQRGAPAVINMYRGIMPAIKRILEKRLPVLYEKCIKPARVRYIDWKRRPRVQKLIEKIYAETPFALFERIEIETRSGCNNTCSFCPVSRLYDTKPVMLMDKDLFLSIIQQLKALEFAGQVALFSNNEPLLDERIYEFCRIAREALPKATLSILTNGLLLTVERLEALMKCLDLLVIDNYDDSLTMIKPVQQVYEYCRQHNLYGDKVKIYLRKKNEVLTNRAGQAKNRTPLPKPLRSSCDLPFKQFIVRPDGLAGLCCHDAEGLMVTGDLTKEKIADVWNGAVLCGIRASLIKGRAYVSICSGCDSGNL